MKANELIKVGISIDEVYANIEQRNGHNQYKTAYPAYIYIEDKVKLQLMADGFKCYIGDLDMMKDAFIIEW